VLGSMLLVNAILNNFADEVASGMFSSGELSSDHLCP